MANFRVLSHRIAGVAGNLFCYEKYTETVVDVQRLDV